MKVGELSLVSQSGERVDWLAGWMAAVPGGGGGVGSPACSPTPGAAVSQAGRQAQCGGVLHL